MLDFTIEKYGKLCSAIKGNYETLTFNEYLNSMNSKSKFIILRHDVDRMPENALKTAEVEHEFNLKSTYYFRTNKSVFRKEIIEEIASLGHEIGYHYECMDKAGGDPEEAIIIFEDELKKFREIYDVKTICMHGNPLTKHDNRDLWNKYDYRKFGIIGEAYLSMKEDVAYFSDTGRTWGKEYKIKDFNINISSNYNNYDCNSNYNSKIKTTDDLINLIKSKKSGNNFTIERYRELYTSTAENYNKITFENT
ncbi:Polysaccharide deacetylase (fragment) [groundwater metagenome]|uniref:Polysaccharide deacetylase n=1 Tax=groundwater metagenome TaxID=717931 RepID=A0A098EFH7_9ZZZZ